MSIDLSSNSYAVWIQRPTRKALQAHLSTNDCAKSMESYSYETHFTCVSGSLKQALYMLLDKISNTQMIYDADRLIPDTDYCEFIIK